MKTFRLLTVCLFLVLFFTACDKKKEEVKPDNAQDNTNTSLAAGQMTAKINGTTWTSQTAFVGQANPEGISINGQANGKSLAITIAGVIKAGNFDVFAYESMQGWYMETGNGTMQTWTSITSNKCKLNITKLDWAAKKMSGTFSFEADSQASSSSTGSFKITDGEFKDLPITVAQPAASTNMTALVNNTSWNGSGMYIFGFPGFYSLTGSDATGQVIGISGINSLQPGPATAGWATFTIPVMNDYQTWGTSSGTAPVVNITSYDPVTKKASGTFSFTAAAINLAGTTGTKSITQGTFTDIPVF